MDCCEQCNKIYIIEEVKEKVDILMEKVDYIESYLNKRSRGFYYRSKNR